MPGDDLPLLRDGASVEPRPGDGPGPKARQDVAGSRIPRLHLSKIGGDEEPEPTEAEWEAEWRAFWTVAEPPPKNDKG